MAALLIMAIMVQGNGINWTAGKERGCKRMPRRRDTRRAAAEGSFRESERLLTTQPGRLTRRSSIGGFQVAQVIHASSRGPRIIGDYDESSASPAVAALALEQRCYVACCEPVDWPGVSNLHARANQLPLVEFHGLCWTR